MTPEWEELKDYVKVERNSYHYAARIYDKMSEIEHRTLPERVAKLIANFDHESWEETVRLSEPLKWSAKFGMVVEKALRTGDLSGLEKWQKK